MRQKHVICAVVEILMILLKGKEIIERNVYKFTSINIIEY